ncbi:anti-sigma factor [Pseudotamlana carrageenivorans]|uniref:Anti-sigma K factor RskA C-terminal domain-containing protein n=1 Tax=Pseudotamlana carrageenivorans TaxID=2069432 RepID=A0A2I7SM07_9FLAO|nr:anti-sigma factor [Tamlana carrageenivorans]AUS06943.1 hypothetical protein C1A40_16485 [Tamlana carrageenivorans]
MIKPFKLFALFALSIGFTNCSNDDDNTPKTSDLTLNIEGLENLGDDYVYEGWIMVDGTPQTTGRFTVNDSGELSDNDFALNANDLAEATAFILTIEPAVGDDPAPSKTHILAGDFNGAQGDLTIAHGAALGDDFSGISGNYFLATPTNSDDTDEKSGLWFLDTSSGSPAAGLDLPVLPEGWKYEGWAVKGQPITTGTFLKVNEMDDFKGFSGPMAGPPFPGEDFLVNAPAGLTFPLDLSGGIAVISIEPDPDNSPAPFLLKPLVGNISSNAMQHVTYNMSPNLSFPSGTVSR